MILWRVPAQRKRAAHAGKNTMQYFLTDYVNKITHDHRGALGYNMCGTDAVLDSNVVQMGLVFTHLEASDLYNNPPAGCWLTNETRGS